MRKAVLANAPEREIALRSRRAFLTLGAGAVAGVAGWRWLWSGEQSDGLPSHVRRVLGFNRSVTASTLFSHDHLAPVFPASEARRPKANGDEGLDDDLNDRGWRAKVFPYGQPHPSHALDLRAIQDLPRVEHVTEIKCIEGWSTVVHWAGARFSDFTRAFAAGSERAQYVGLQTPDNGYYVGIDMASALHPQTLLCYEMNGAPLTPEHGAPLRLVIPVKYGIKNLKRIGAIAYTDTRPRDFWFEQGYDYYAGL